MSQLNWVFLDDFGKRYDIGLYHGNKTGHLMVYCNSNVILIDFNVLESKLYSFYLGEELCELEIKKKSEQFSYSLKPNRTADTPLNHIRRHTEKKNQLKIAIIGVILILVVIFVFLLSKTIS